MATIPVMPTFVAGQVPSAAQLNAAAAGVNFTLGIGANKRPIAQFRKVGPQLVGSANGPYPPSAYIAFDVIDVDTDGMWTPNNTLRMTIRTPGLYLVSGLGSLAAVMGGTIRALALFHNDGIIAEVNRSVDYPVPAGSGDQMTVTTMERFAVGDWFTMGWYQDSGGNVGLGSVILNRMSALWLET